VRRAYDELEDELNLQRFMSLQCKSNEWI